jgi:hypothetical protein
MGSKRDLFIRFIFAQTSDTEDIFVDIFKIKQTYECFNHGNFFFIPKLPNSTVVVKGV